MRLNKNKIFLNKFCNFDKLNSIFLSFDIDWAPDYMIENLLKITKNHNLTIFNTHNSKILKFLNKKKITLGVHPNIQKNSSQGNNLNKVKNFIKKLGSVKYSRFHLLGHSYNDLRFFAKSGVKIDSSVLIYNQAYLTPTYHPDIDLVRVPYIWEDGMTHNFKINMKKSLDLNSPGIKILDFHPLDIYFNTWSISHRNEIKKYFPTLLRASQKDAEKFINKKKFGAQNFLLDILNFIKIKKLKTFNFEELNYEFRKNIK
jgi:hypothetical protein